MQKSEYFLSRNRLSLHPGGRVSLHCIEDEPCLISVIDPRDPTARSTDLNCEIHNSGIVSPITSSCMICSDIEANLS